MPFYNLAPLPLPAGYDYSRPHKINDHQAVVGKCSDNNNTKAILWEAGGFTLLNLAGQYSEASSLNLNNNVVGWVDGKPFFWEKSTGITTILKGIDGQPANVGQALGINKFNQITGWLRTPGGDKPIVWPSITDIPIDLFTGVPFKPPTPWGNGTDINDNGLIVGFAADTPGMLSGIGSKGFSWTINNFKLFLDLNFTGQPNYHASAVNDLVTPQIVGWVVRDYGANGGWVPYLYDSLTSVLKELGVPGQPSQFGMANDVNNNGDVVGNTGSYNPHYPDAVLWIFNGLIRINLNHPTISNAKAKGWHLLSASSINNNGCIVGWGWLNGDENTQLPWILKPIFPIRKIPIEYMLPQALWPGQAYDGPRPKGWPLKLPFPIPSPNPFQIVGSAFTHLNNVLIGKKLNEITNTISDSKARKAIQKIASQLIDEEMKKLKVILANVDKPVKKADKKSISSKGRK